MEKIKVKTSYGMCIVFFLITIKNLVGLVDIEVGQVNFAKPLARGQVLKNCICQPLQTHHV